MFAFRKFLSRFNPQPSMATDYTSIILRKSDKYQTDAYLTFFRSWSNDFLEQPNETLESFFDQIEVTCLMHNKMITAPEHEFVILETVDHSKKTTCTILVERNVIIDDDSAEKSPPKTPIERPGILESMKEILAIPSDLASIEEGNSLMVSLSKIDKLTLSSAKVANVASKSIEKFQKYSDSAAVDQFLGEKFVFGIDRHGECVRYFKPKLRLSLFEVAILAEVIHQEYPKYVLLAESCYFFSAVLYQALEQIFGASESCTFGASAPSITEDNSNVVIRNSSLSNRFGRSRGALIVLAEPSMIDNVVTKFHTARQLEVATMNRRLHSRQHAMTNAVPTSFTMRKRTNTIVYPSE
jgi:hypothetical protein